ncbi:MAG TPA: phosphoribosyltransferase family protein [Acidimicrobiia bacterium]|jgi:predicted phosphoribosyltransferase
MFRNRTEAGQRLGELLARFAVHRPVVLALPRGGVPVGREVADALDAPLDVLLVRKLGVPRQPELAMGAIGEGGVRVLNDEVIRAVGVPERDLAKVEARETEELERRVHMFRGDRPQIEVDGRVVVVVDDGLATGATAQAALRVARARGARTLVLAVPVAPPDTLAHLAADADEIVAAEVHQPFGSIGDWYRDFRQTTDEQVLSALDPAAP